MNSIEENRTTPVKAQLVLGCFVVIDARSIALQLFVKKIVGYVAQSVQHGFAKRHVVVHSEKDLSSVGSTSRLVDEQVEQGLQILAGTEVGGIYSSSTIPRIHSPSCILSQYSTYFITASYRS